ncbi:MAG: hypothetical protein HY554_14630, partial [Elusimicrobia bacterium]|nr:hypothetical protein [Elusimicrobiota bacterium]
MSAASAEAFRLLALAAFCALGASAPAGAAVDQDVDQLTIRVTPRDIYPPVPVTDLAGTAGSEGQALLQWTAPDESLGVAPKAVPVASYVIRYSTASVDELGGNTTAWFNSALPLPAPPPLLPGAQQSLLTTLEGGVTYYFGLRSVDDEGLSSDLDARTRTPGAQARVPVKGIRGVTDLRAVPGAAFGDVQLTWTEPTRIGEVDPVLYELRVSTLANIGGIGEFLAAKPLTSFSSTNVPPAASAGGPASLVVTGLAPGVTHYFAIRGVDSGVPAFTGAWRRDPALGLNGENYTQARYDAVPPLPVTDLTAAITAVLGQVHLAWTVPASPGGAAIRSYTVRLSTLSVAASGGDAEAWYLTAPAQSIVVSSTKTAGQVQELFFGGLEPGSTYFFGVKAEDVVGQASPIDTRAASVSGQARLRLESTSELFAAPGPESGSIALSWNQPFSGGLIAPLAYDIRAATAANLDNGAAFDAAAPLSAFSASAIPAPGAGGTPLSFVVTGLTPDATYYFAIRLVDSDAPPFRTGWFRDVASALNDRNFAIARFLAALPDPITDLAAAGGSVEGDVRLTWTAPRNPNYVKLDRYAVRYATFSAAALGGDTTSWFNLAPGSATVQPAGAPGTVETLLLQGLFPVPTYYFAIRAFDVYDEAGYLDAKTASGAQASTRPFNLPPAVPSGLAVGPGRNRLTASWTALSAAEKGLDFSAYRLYRSTEPSASFALAVSTAETGFVDKPLKPFVNYYYRVSAIDQAGLESALSAGVSAEPYTLGPQEPFGVAVAASPTTLRLEWTPTARFADGEAFFDPASPLEDELIGYQVQRSTDLCSDFELLAVTPSSVTAHVDAIGAAAYYYRVQSFNSIDVSTPSVTLDRFGRRVFSMDDCLSRLEIDDVQAAALSAGTNGYAEDILLERNRKPEEAGGKVLQAVEIKPLLGGHTELKGFHFPKPVKVQLHFFTENGVPVPQTAAVSAERAFGQRGTYGVGSKFGAAAAEGGAAKDLGVFWHNGIEYKKLYGKVDTQNQVVAVETPNVGAFQLRTLYRDAGVTFDLSNITSRIFSPNGDGLNDSVTFLFDNPKASHVEGKIY